MAEVVCIAGRQPPVVVFTDPLTVKKTAAKEWQLQIPMRRQNMAGAVEVVLESRPARAEMGAMNPTTENYETRQLTGCTSPRTTVVFLLSDNVSGSAQWTDVLVLDAWGAVLARAELPKLPH